MGSIDNLVVWGARLSSPYLFAWMCLSSCATIAEGTVQQLHFKSSPEEAVVTLTKKVPEDELEGKWHEESRVLGTTPLTIEIDRDELQSVTFKKEGFKPETMALPTRVNGWFWGNILLGGVIGSAVDALSGAVYEYSQDQYFVVLTPEGGSRVEDATLKANRDKVRAFVIKRHPALLENLNRGGGEELESLLRLLNVPPGQEGVVRRKLRSLAEVYDSPADFADHAAALFLK